MKKYVSILLLLMALDGHAYHIMGGEITYKYIGNDSFLVTATMYRNCKDEGITSLPLYVGGVGCSYSNWVYLQKKSCGDATPVCSRSCSKCDKQNCNAYGFPNGTNANCTFPFGLERLEFEGYIDLSGIQCSKFTLSINGYTRSSQVTTCCVGDDFYIDAFLDKTAKNSTPLFDEVAVPIVCAGHCADISFHARDSVDGDSLSYHLVPAKNSDTTYCTYAKGYSSIKPLMFYGYPNGAYGNGACRGFQLEPTTGLIKCNFTQQQIGIVVCEIREWRKDSIGVPTMIGAIRRDIQIIVLANCNNKPPIINSPTYIEFCGSDSVRLNGISIHDSDTKDTLTTQVVSGFAGLQWKANSISKGNIKTMDLEFKADSTWADGTSRNVLVSVMDNACPLPAHRHEVVTFTRTDRPKGNIKFAITSCLTYTMNVLRQSAAKVVEWDVYDSTTNVYYTDTMTHTFSKPGSYVVGAKIQLGSCDNWIYDTLTVGYDTIQQGFLGSDKISCSNDTIKLSAPNLNNGTLLWNNGNTLPDLYVTQSGTYSCQLTNAKGCQFNDSINVQYVVPGKPDLGPDIFLCNYDTVKLDAGAGFFKYGWSTGDTSSIVYTNQSGIYSCATTDSNNCSSSDVLTIYINPVLKPHITGNSSICPTDTTLLDAGSGYEKYIWNTGDTTQSTLVNSAGNYNVKVSNAFGCKDSASVQVKKLSAPNAAFTYQKVQDSFLFSPVYIGQGSYHWLFGDGDASSLQSPYHHYTSAGTWAVSLNLTDSNGCREDSSQVISNVGLTDNWQLTTGNPIRLYPNPSSGSFMLETPKPGIYSITDMAGKEMQKGNLNAGTNTLNLNAASGCYILLVGEERVRLMVW